MLTKLCCLLLDLVLVVPFAIIRVFHHCTGGDGTKAIVTTTNKPHIILIHGSGSNETQFYLAKGWLEPFYTVHTINLGQRYTFDNTIESYAADLEVFIQDLKISNVTLLGVSMGGLVACMYAELFKPHGITIERIITIGTPFQGAPILGWLNTNCPSLFRRFASNRHKEMTPGSALLLSFSSRLRNTKHTFLTIGSQSDLHVPDKYSYPLEIPKIKHHHVTLRAPGHIALSVDKRIFKLITDTI